MFYIAHRLFAAHDRALAAHLAHHLAAKTGADAVFLPFCDTDEENLQAPVKGLRLFELDRRRLRTLTGMIAILHGPSLDDGVCMEIGYAAALGVPVIVMTTDFQTYSHHPNSSRWEFTDPLIETITRRVVRVPRLGTLPPADDTADRFAAFASRNHHQTDEAVARSVDALLDAATGTGERATPSTAPARAGSAFFEPSPYTPVPEQVAEAVRIAGYGLRMARRFAAADTAAAARADWNEARHAETLIADVSGPETPPGAAALIGAAAAQGRRIGAYLPHPVLTHAPGREPNWRNLMIQYAAGHHLSTPDDLTTWLHR
ncbi:nucleoside 2-deoxyribosyltransferase [Streptomyces rimosus]|uniref:nucleoside 2-deoxyribosyltransferase n=1 Tax=Streptomyces rimosus TaxID=1927 RepID=UPI0037CF87AD